MLPTWIEFARKMLTCHNRSQRCDIRVNGQFHLYIGAIHMLETLESRLLLSVTPRILLREHTLEVRGTDSVDTVTVNLVDSDANLEVLVLYQQDGQTKPLTAKFASALVGVIDVRTGTGNDDVRIESTIAVRCVLFGGGGADILAGGAGNDRIFGGEGDDVILGGDGRDRVRGGNQNDQIVGQGGHDVLNGGDGDDWLDGGLETDYISGATGKDHINLGFEGKSPIGQVLGGSDAGDILSPGPGFDHVEFTEGVRLKKTNRGDIIFDDPLTSDPV